MTSPENMGRQFVNAFHMAPRSKRRAIAAEGIKPSGNSMDMEMEHSKGAFFFQRREDLEWYAGDSHPGRDIWYGRVPLERTHEDPWLEDANYTHKTIKSPQRVGHTTESGEIHWHPEEHCNG
jgi:hypothetical protein